MPAKTAWGICDANGASTTTTAKRKAACNTPESLVTPPVRILTTVRMVAPAPGMPPKNPAAILPTPWPINSRLELCRVRVILSATNDVSRLSIAPNMARIRAASIMIKRASLDTEGMIKDGKPVGMFPSMGTLSNPKLTQVPTINATSGLGRYLPHRAGQAKTMASVSRPTPSAL